MKRHVKVMTAHTLLKNDLSDNGVERFIEFISTENLPDCTATKDTMKKCWELVKEAEYVSEARKAKLWNTMRGRNIYID